eukprot:SAG11_NODE_1858_length_4159_cov_22.716256_5_plen_81_part_00
MRSRSSDGGDGDGDGGATRLAPRAGNAVFWRTFAAGADGALRFLRNTTHGSCPVMPAGGGGGGGGGGGAEKWVLQRWCAL